MIAHVVYAFDVRGADRIWLGATSTYDRTLRTFERRHSVLCALIWRCPSSATAHSALEMLRGIVREHAIGRGWHHSDALDLLLGADLTRLFESAC